MESTSRVPMAMPTTMETAKTRTPSAAARVTRKRRGSDFVQRSAEAAVDELVGGEHLAGEVARQEERCHDNAAEHVADNDLEEAEVAREGDAGDGDDREGRGLGGDYRKRDGPPRDGVVGEKVALERAIRCGGSARFAKAKAEERDADEVDDDREVEGMQAGRESECRQRR